MNIIGDPARCRMFIGSSLVSPDVDVHDHSSLGIVGYFCKSSFEWKDFFEITHTQTLPPSTKTLATSADVDPPRILGANV
jgi:hypothetical protein